VGAITDVVRRYVPGSYSALISTTNNYYGSTDLQALANYAKYRLFGTSVAEASEAAIYDVEQVQLLGILTTLHFIPAAVEYWGTQLASESTVGPSENVVYRDPRPELWNLFDKLVAEAQALSNDLGIGLTRGTFPKISYGDNGRGILVTPDPFCFPPPYDSGNSNVLQRIPWGEPV
jgi:hypothetical protein